MSSRIRKNYRRLLAFLLTVAMVITNLSANLTVAFAAGESERALFLLEGAEIREAVHRAEEEGEVFKFSSLELKAGRKSIKNKYEKLLGSKEGKVYQLDLEIDDSYAPEGTSLEVYYNEGTKDVVFLFINESDMVVDFHVNVDGYETAAVTVAPNTENVEDEDASYAEDYQSGTMIDDVKEKPDAEVVNPQGTKADETSGKETEAAVENEADHAEETETADEAEANEETDDAEETGEAGADGVGETTAEENEEESSSSKETETEEEIVIETEAENEAEAGSETEEEIEVQIETEDETEEEIEIETEDEKEETGEESDEENEADGELLSVSRHEAAVVAVSLDDLGDEDEIISDSDETEIEEEIEEETEEETEKETEAETEDETEAETEEETEEETEDETEAETEEETKAETEEETETKTEEETEAKTEEKETETENVEIDAAEEESKAAEADTEDEAKAEEESPVENEGLNEEEIDDDSSDDLAEKKDDFSNIEGQLLEDDSIELLGELKGKDFKTVTIRDHANARAYKVAWEDIEEIILEDSETEEVQEYQVDYQVNIPEAAAVKGEDSVAEGENLYFAVEPKEGFEIVSVTANGEELNEVEDVSGLASASNWKGYSFVYMAEEVGEDLWVDVEMEEVNLVAVAAAYTAETDDAIITVEVPDGAFEEEVELHVEKIDEEAMLQELTAQAEKALEEGQTVEGILAYDIKFVTASKEEVEPSKPVDVRISFKENAIPEEITENATAVSVVHVPDGKEAEVETTVESAEVTELAFQAESFSVRMAVFTRNAEIPRDDWIRVSTPEELHSAIYNNIKYNNNDTEEVVKVKIYLDNDITTEFDNTDNRYLSDWGWAIPGKHDFTLDLNGHTLTYGGEGREKKRLFFVRGTLTITDNSDEKTGTITQSENVIDGLIYVGGGTLNLEGGTITAGSHINSHAILIGANLDEKNIKPDTDDAKYSGGTLNMSGGCITGNGNEQADGGGIYVYKGNVNISGGSIENNEARNGGGIYGCSNAAITVSGGSIKSNISKGGGERSSGKDFGGGGIFSRGYLTLTGGTIESNEAESGGGGIYVDIDMSKWWLRDQYGFSMSGGKIHKNKAQCGEGGGIYFGWNGLITGGEITENETETKFDWGGGGIFTQTGVTLTIHNALITGNTADGFGGGVAGCPSGNIYILTINGAAIFANTAQGTACTAREEGAGKTDDQSAREDQAFINSGYADYYCEKVSTVYGNMLGGGNANWHGSRDGASIEIGRDNFARAENRMGLTSYPSDEDKETAQKYAKVQISGNSSSTHGGGIMSNGTLILGSDIEKVSISGQKKWNGDKESDRPSSITIRLLKNGKECARKIIEGNKEIDTWNWSFEGMPKYDADNNEEISYSVEEVPVSGYKTKIEGSNNSFVITNTYDPNLISVKVRKLWVDKDNQDGMRPDEVTINLLKDKVKVEPSLVLNQGNGWSGSFINLPKKENGKDIKWTLEEEKVDGYTTEIAIETVVDPDSEEKMIEVENSYVVTNTHIPETIDISGTKIWNDNHNQDGKRPESITLILYEKVKGSTEEYSFLKKEIIKVDDPKTDSWSWSIRGLSKYRDGKELEYKVEEKEVDGYTSEITSSISGGLNITNTYTPKTITISGTKNWDDNHNQDGKRPTSITVKLYKRYKDSNEKDNPYEFLRDETITADDPTSDSWAWSIEELPQYENGKELEYKVEEEEVDRYTSEITGSISDGFNIKNTHIPERITIPVTKTWLDQDDQDGVRPNSIEVVLLKDEELTEEVIILDDSNDWKGEFKDLYKYENGEPIQWRVKEKESSEKYVPSIELVDTSDLSKGYQITNTHTPESIDIKGEKIWDDNNDQDGKRPDSITIVLYADNTKIDSKTVSNADGWKWSFDGLPKYRDKGTLIHYTFGEEILDNPGYMPKETEAIDPDEHNGYFGKITNVYTPEKTYRVVLKNWDDNDDQDGVRPAEIQVQLMANGINVGDPITLNEANNWKGQWGPLDMYDNGELIKYEVAEIETQGQKDHYSPQIIFDDKNTFTITNTHVPSTVKRTIIKKWEDSNDQDNLRPSSITVQLRGDDIAKDTIILNESNQWTYTWEDLPQYEHGKEITYTIVETSNIEGYTASTSTNDEGDVITITNVHTPDKPDTPDTPDKPDTPEDPDTPDKPSAPPKHHSSSGGGGRGGGGRGPSGGNNTGGPGETTTQIDQPDVPLADFKEVNPDLIPMVEEDVPLASFLPKTGDSRNVAMWMFVFGVAGIGMLATAIGLKKKRKEDQ